MVVLGSKQTSPTNTPSYTLAFFDKYLRGMKPALLDEPPTSEFIEAVQRFEPAKFPCPTCGNVTQKARIAIRFAADEPRTILSCSRVCGTVDRSWTISHGSINDPMVGEISDSVAHFGPHFPSIFATAIQRSPPSGRSIRVSHPRIRGDSRIVFWFSWPRHG
jgi:hypothetical protein